jgi:hypothetical protein
MQFNFVSTNPNAIKHEFEHSAHMHIAMCGLEARSVIAEVAYITIKAMAEQDAGYPIDLLEGDKINPTDEADKKANLLWKEKIAMMLEAFELSHETEDYERTAEQQAKIEAGLLEFATWFEHLWV